MMPLTSSQEDQQFLDVAIGLAQKSSQLVLDLLKNPASERWQNQKADHSIVTEADLKSDEIIQHGKDKRPILKVAPLVNFTEAELRKYATENQVPTHKLLNWNQDGWHYESLGCVVCTTPIGPNEPRRAGRWRWFNALEDDDKECGIHSNKIHKDEV